MFFNIKKGHSRIVFLIWKYAFKCPSFYIPFIRPFNFLKKYNGITYNHIICSKKEKYSYIKNNNYYKVIEIKNNNFICKCVRLLLKIKIYYFNELTFKVFLEGLFNNLIEKEMYSIGNNIFCPVYFSLLGFINIMPRCRELTDNEFKQIKYDDFCCFKWYPEYKKSSFGILNNKIVAIDYGFSNEIFNLP